LIIERVTQHVGAALGIPITGVLTGTEIEALSDEALAAWLEETNLFCRVTPVQKNRTILGLKHRGHVVSYLGVGAASARTLLLRQIGVRREGDLLGRREADRQARRDW
jgi:Mg2+-importing ATPase